MCQMINFLFARANSENDIDIIIDCLQNCSLDELYVMVSENREMIIPITAKVIPQFSNFDDVDNVIQIIDDSVDVISREYIGYMLNKNASKGAQIKYGENHLKLAMMLGLVTEKPYEVTSLGRMYMKLPVDERRIIRTKLCLRIPVIQQLLVISEDKIIDGTEFLKQFLSEKTAIRRRSNAKMIIRLIFEQSSLSLKRQIMDNIVWS